MLTLCKYKGMFGKLNQGLHSFRIFNIAIVDVLLTILAAFIIYPISCVFSHLIYLFS